MDEAPPASDIERVERFCLTRIPTTLHDEVRLDVVVADGGIVDRHVIPWRCRHGIPSSGVHSF